jgi:hypothetical protein
VAQHAAFFTAAEGATAQTLIDCGQAHVFGRWAMDTAVDALKKRAFLASLAQLNVSVSEFAHACTMI